MNFECMILNSETFVCNDKAIIIEGASTDLLGKTCCICLLHSAHRRP